MDQFEVWIFSGLYDRAYARANSHTPLGRGPVLSADAHHFVSNGATYNNIQGDYIVRANHESERCIFKFLAFI